MLSTSRNLDDLLNIDNIHFEQMVHRIYPAELQLNKANASDTEAAFLDLTFQFIMIQFLEKYMSRDARKSVFGVSDQVRHKPGSAAAEDG